MNIKEKNWRKNFYLFNGMCKTVFFFIALFVLLSCQTLFKKKSSIPDNLSIYKSGTFTGTMIIYEKGKKHYFTGNILISKEKKALRMDLRMVLGFPVGSFLLKEEELTVLLLQTKMFYKGQNVSGFFPVFFPKELKLSTFSEVFFDRPPKGGHWICRTNEKGLPVECHEERKSLLAKCQTDVKNPSVQCPRQIWTISWQREKSRVVSFKTSQFHFIFQPSFFSSEVDEDLFFLKIPKNFQPIAVGIK